MDNVERMRKKDRNLQSESKYNGAFGYFIELQSLIFTCPEHYIRKQTMTNAERFPTEQLRQKKVSMLKKMRWHANRNCFSPWLKTP